MDLESIVLYLNNKDIAAVEIHTKINYGLQEGTVGYSTVTRHLRKQSCADSSTVPQRTVKSRFLTHLTMLFSKGLTNSLVRHFLRLPRGF
jgi:hypothetical protein